MRRTVALALSLLASTSAFAVAPAPVGADNGMVVTAQHLASEVGARVLKEGGNVVDAAVAVGYALAVVFPAAGNLGGGGFVNIRFADGRSSFVDMREKAPGATTPTMFQDGQGNVVPGRSTSTWLAVGVPGTVAGLEWAREHYGTRPRADLLAPAIRLARDGFALEPGDVSLLQQATPTFAADPATATIFTRGGRPFAVGDRLVQTDLAATLEAISAGGADGFYRGRTADAIAAASRAGGGIITEGDLAAYRARELKPVRCSYRGYDIQSAPPPSAGGVAICEILQILEGYDLGAMGYHSAAEVHTMVEAMRRAYRDRQGLGDPDFVKNDIAKLVDKDYAAGLRAGIDPDKATPSTALVPPPDQEGRQTTHYSVADGAGNAVSVTYTLNSWFGLGRVAGNTGVLMNNEMDDFASKTGASNQFGLVGSDANGVQPGKTPISSMSPTIVSKDGKLAMVIGSPGGSTIITTVVQAIVNVVDHGMTVSAAIDAPRFHMQWMPDVVTLEPFALSPDTRRILEREGYGFKDRAPWGQAAGITTEVFGRDGGGNDLAIPDLSRPPKAYKLYGADDDRDPVGSAAGY
ncbi:gamma-glutamyltransferase [Lichenibacterium dinghuense]|uniref:gamma-glutamyltransferase n=1 Tax=Lichenibacterium dinghuense TaxID=2895977 RepID=UPI001F016FFA|nr:gamma-glutamyltransferase [Lichenibacterium sp. 6Y81]